MTNAVVKFPTSYRPDVKFDIAEGYQFYGYTQQGSGHFCMGVNGPGGCLWREVLDLETGDTPTLITLHKYVFAEVWRSQSRWWQIIWGEIDQYGRWLTFEQGVNPGLWGMAILRIFAWIDIFIGVARTIAWAMR